MSTCSHRRTMCMAVLAAALSVAGAGLARADCAMLYALAQEHADDMARRESLDHAGFFRERGPRGAMAENVAVGCATEACAIDVWMKSPPHRANMMLGGCQAVASAVSKNGRRYWAMEIGGGGGGVAVNVKSRGRVRIPAVWGYHDGAVDSRTTP
jgi:hypothetical protein